jgi:hypothetical protein
LAKLQRKVAYAAEAAGVKLVGAVMGPTPGFRRIGTNTFEYLG